MGTSTISTSSNLSDEEEIKKKKQQRVIMTTALVRKKTSSNSDSSSSSSSSLNEKEIEYLYDQNFFELRETCLKSKKLFEDPEFPADNDLLRERSHRYEEDVEWLRPHDIVRPDDPVLITDRNEGFNIRQGLDSWFVPAMSAIAESEYLLRQVVPRDQGFTEEDKYAGIFRFRFWFGRWIEIVIDDRIPVRKGVPIYIKSASPLEFWPIFLEKAYAKAKGSYELLNNWMPIDGCIELTGGTPERVRDLNALLTPDAKAADRLFLDLTRACKLGNVILVSPPKKSQESKLSLTEASQLGLEVKYVYRVTQVVNLGQDRRLVRVKNCSGPNPINWIGAWHPSDTRWANISDEVRKDIDSETFHDGGFWMAYGDFLKYFKTLDICHLNQDVDQDITFHGRWELGLNSGGVQKGDFKNYAKNPQCFIHLEDPDPRDPERNASAIISLMQKRKSRTKGMNKIGFKVFRVEEDVDELSYEFFSLRRNDGSHKNVAKTPTWQDGRETNIRVRLPPGKYCIIPSTYQPDAEGDFILRVHIEQYSKETSSIE